MYPTQQTAKRGRKCFECIFVYFVLEVLLFFLLFFSLASSIFKQLIQQNQCIG